MPRRNYRPERRVQLRRIGNGQGPKTKPLSQDLDRIKVQQIPLLPHVETSGECPTGKMRYGTAEDAAEALRRAWINREILQSPVVEERWYPQRGDAPCICRGYHLTSAPRRDR